MVLYDHHERPNLEIELNLRRLEVQHLAEEEIIGAANTGNCLF